MGRFIKTTFGFLLTANVALTLLLFLLVGAGNTAAVRWLGVSAPGFLPWVWTPLTYMFTQDSVLNLLFNLLWLYVFNRVFMEVGTQRQMLLAYLCGGLCGAAAFLLASLAGLSSGIL